MMKYTIECILGVLLASCGPTLGQRMNALMGRPFHEAIASFGPPHQVMPDGQGGSILVYSTSHTNVNVPPPPQLVDVNQQSRTKDKLAASFANGFMQGMSQPSVTTTVQHRMFFVNAQGIVYNWSIGGW